MIRFGWSVLTVLIAAVPLAAQDKKLEDARTSDAPEPRTVSFKTADGVEIAASYYEPTKTGKQQPKAPAAVLVHMYPADRHSWKPIVPRLLEAGFAVLAYDIRGKGGSAGDRALARRYTERDGPLFVDAWQDADAAVKWLGEQKHVDTSRIVMLGASIGCSISLDYAARNENVRAVVCLSPGTNYFGVDSKAHIKKCGARPILLCAPEAERSEPQELKALAEKAVLDIRPGDRSLHGTNMFGAKYGDKLMDRIVTFLKKGLEEAEKQEDAKKKEETKKTE
ncbi:MAG: alpha/beta fold hydrolase [Phycisphaerae bacterium]|nr:alpha/beta fold hydrolase [Phycisphaerae bacterium]NUQ45484.1 alpha/beta fold hydrolase [Phycisphaerae bacterium]